MRSWGTSALAFVMLLVGVVALLSVTLPERFDDSPVVRRQVQSRSTKIGVHTRLTDEVEEWKVNKTLAMVREMGASYAVEFFPWAYIEPRKGSFDWKHADMVINRAYAEGLTIVARLDLVPDWARPKNSTPRYLAKEGYQEFGDFVYAFVKRYKGKVQRFIIWNEPNTAFEWGFQPVSPEDYVDLLQVAYKRAKEADPDAIVLSAGLAPTLEKSDLALNDLDYLQRMYDAGAREYFDAMAVHAYGGKYPPDDPPAPDKLNFARVTLVRQVMERNSDAGKPIVITEAGWNDHPRWTKAVRPLQRIDYTVRAYQKVDEEWPWVEAVAMWAFRLPWPARNYNDYYTFVDSEFNPKPVYDAVKKYARE
ncbi:MAG: endo-1,4-beta-xylanase [Chloroflexi bacterium]|nr:endo-1,4-beta-xylanase [Chloroflexota bacterium]